MTQLSPRTLELLEILQEECAEVIQAVSKIKRFGIDSYHPDDRLHVSNIQHLIVELGDVVGMADMLIKTELGEQNLNWDTISDASNAKKIKVMKFLRT